MEFAYSYHLPKSLIAKRPATPRDSSKLFVYDAASDGIIFDHFSNLENHLPKNSLLVLNNTKVVPARTTLRKETGGKVEVLFLVNEWDKRGAIPTIVDRKVNIGARLSFGNSNNLTVIRQDKNIFYLKPYFTASTLYKNLDALGVTPIPKYIKTSGMGEAELRKRYQAVFGRHSVSVAAPTASLHFTERLLAKLHNHGVRKTFVTLDIGLGTFAPIKEENMITKTLHTEFLRVPLVSARAIRKQKVRTQPVVAVGTTAVRTLESEAEKILDAHRTAPIIDKTRIFIRPPHRFKIVDAMITNFHLPETSLMMLVQAFLEYKHADKTLVELYKIAIKENFRFYSFGDAMFIK